MLTQVEEYVFYKNSEKRLGPSQFWDQFIMADGQLGQLVCLPRLYVVVRLVRADGPLWL